MTAFINNRALTNGEFVYVQNGVTYVGRAQSWSCTQQHDQLSRCTLSGVIMSQQRNEQPAGPRGRLTVQVLPWSQLPLVGDRDTLYVVTTGEDDMGRRLFDEAAYVYRPDDREGPDPQPYKATNVSAAVVARLHDSGDQIPSQTAIVRDSSAVPVHYVPPSSANESLAVCTRDNFIAWMPIEWRLNEIPARSRPGHVVLPEHGVFAPRVDVRGVLQSEAAARIEDENGARFFESLPEIPAAQRVAEAMRRARQTGATALQTAAIERRLRDETRLGLQIQYIGHESQLPEVGDESALYLIFGHEMAYVWRAAGNRTWSAYCPTNLVASFVANNFRPGELLPHAETGDRFSVYTADSIDVSNLYIRPNGERAAAILAHDSRGEQFCVADRLLVSLPIVEDGLANLPRFRESSQRRDNAADHAFTLPPGTAIPTRAVQGDPVAVPMLRDLSLEQVAEMRGVRFVDTWGAVGASTPAPLAPAVAPSPPPQMLPVSAGRRRILPLNG